MHMRSCYIVSVVCAVVSISILHASQADSNIIHIKTPACYIKRDHNSGGSFIESNVPTYYVENADCWYIYVSLPESNPKRSDIDTAIAWLRSQGVEDDFIFEYIFYEIGKRCERGDYSVDQGCDLVYYMRELGIDGYHNMIPKLDEDTLKKAIDYMHHLRIPHEIRLHKIKHDIRYLYFSGAYDYGTAFAWFQYAQDCECLADLQNLRQGIEQDKEEAA